MGNITDLNILEREKAAFARDLGTAHEYLVAAILMRLGFDVSVATLGGMPYDLIIEIPKEEVEYIRAQVKTVGDTSINFTGGGRGGVDREYISDEKIYKYSEKHAELLIGVKKDTLDLYLVPTKIVGRYKEKSKSINKLQPCKNNWELLKNWGDETIEKLWKQLPK